MNYIESEDVCPLCGKNCTTNSKWQKSIIENGSYEFCDKCEGTGFKDKRTCDKYGDVTNHICKICGGYGVVPKKNKKDKQWLK